MLFPLNVSLKQKLSLVNSVFEFGESPIKKIVLKMCIQNPVLELYIKGTKLKVIFDQSITVILVESIFLVQ